MPQQTDELRRRREISTSFVVHGIFLVYPGTCWHIVVVCIVIVRFEEKILDFTEQDLVNLRRPTGELSKDQYA